MTIIFKAKTNSAYTIKILAELLQNNIKTACFEIDESGIKLCMMNHNRTILIHLFLESENFTLYKYKQKDRLYLGINLNHLHRMMKSVKKKDSLCLFIEQENPTDLGIKVIPKENNRITTSFIKIQSIQTIDTSIPDGYGKPIIVPSAEYQKLAKDMSHIGSSINISAKNYHIQFKCNAGGVLKRNVEFGDMGDSDNDDDDNIPEYDQEFETEQLCRITKIAGLSSNIQIYTQNKSEIAPILFKSAVGSLGKISIYIKSKLLTAQEQTTCESDQDE